MTYKVYRKGNFIIIESSNGIDIFNVPVQNMVINRANNIYPVYDFFDDGNSILSGISISYLNDENGINYSIDEFENFRTTECGYEPLDLNGGNDPNAPATIDFEAKTYYAKLATAAPLRTCAYNNGAGTLTGSSNGILSQNNQTGKIDNVTPVLNDKILVKNQTPATQNGVYVVTQLGNGSNPFILTRVSDYNESSEIYPSVVFISEGSLNNSKYFTQDTENPTIGTDPIVYKVSSVPFPASVIVFVDTTTSAALPACTYANGTVYSTAPGVGATLKANANDALGTINGVSMTSGRRIIVKNQANQAHNGVYTVTEPGVAGGSGRPWILTRTVADSNSLYRSREFAVTNPSSTFFGTRWTISSPLTMTNANWGTTNIVFREQGDEYLYTEVLLSANDVRSLNWNTGFNLLPALSNGNYYDVDKMAYEFNYVDDDFLCSDPGTYLTAWCGNIVINIVSISLITSSLDSRYILCPTGPEQISNADEVPYFASSNNTNSLQLDLYLGINNNSEVITSGGNSTLRVKIWYRVRKFGTEL